MKREFRRGWLILVAIGLYLGCAAAAAFADNRTENIDLFLILDKSLSMQPKIQAVREYVDKSIIQGMLIPGDHLTVITFWGQAHVLLSTTVGSDKAPIENVINSIQANGYFTDIGNALDELKSVLARGNYPNHRKYFMLITDGLQEAPPTSKYYSPTGTFNHAFLDNTKIIQEKGWKIEILGIGTQTAAAELAKTLSGGFASVPSNPTPQELAKATENFLSLLQASHVTLSPVGLHGNSILHLTLTSIGYTTPQTVQLGSVQLETSNAPAATLVTNRSLTVPPKGAKSFDIPVTLPTLPPGGHSGRIVVTFTGNSTFTPAVFDVKFSVNGFVQNYLSYEIGGLVLVVLLLGLALLLVRRSVSQSRVRFTMVIESDLRQSNKFTLRRGDDVLVEDTPMGFRPVEKKIENPVARVFFDPAGLHFEVVNHQRIPSAEVPPNVLGATVHAKTNAGKDVVFKFVGA